MFGGGEAGQPGDADEQSYEVPVEKPLPPGQGETVFAGSAVVPTGHDPAAPTHVFGGSADIDDGDLFPIPPNAPQQPAVSHLSGQVSSYTISPLAGGESSDDKSGTMQFMKGIGIGIALLVGFALFANIGELLDGPDPYQEHVFELVASASDESHLEASTEGVDWNDVHYVDLWPNDLTGKGRYEAEPPNKSEYEDYDDDYSRGQIHHIVRHPNGTTERTLLGGWEASNQTVWLDLPDDSTAADGWHFMIEEDSESAGADIAEIVGGLFCLIGPIGAIVLIVKIAKKNQTMAWGIAAAVVGGPVLFGLIGIGILIIFGF